MPGSKPGALPLGDIPTINLILILVLNKNMVRKERLELSHPKILEPKSSASTNSATPASYIQVTTFWNLNPASNSRQLPIPSLPHTLCNKTLGSYFKLFIEQQKIMVAKTGFEPVTPSL
jgi:hypothetical protein